MCQLGTDTFYFCPAAAAAAAPAALAAAPCRYILNCSHCKKVLLHRMSDLLEAEGGGTHCNDCRPLFNAGIYKYARACLVLDGLDRSKTETPHWEKDPEKVRSAGSLYFRSLSLRCLRLTHLRYCLNFRCLNDAT